MQKMILIFSLLTTSFAFADSAGEITFSGSIIEEANCQVATHNKKVQLNCYNNNEVASTHEVISQSQLKYLDQEKTLAVMYLTYH